MKTSKLALAAALLASLVSIVSAQDLSRNYKVGAVDKYQVTVTATTSMGEVVSSSKMIHKVIKVYPNGDADIETSTEDAVVTFMGQEMPAGAAAPKIVAKVDKYGRPVGKDGKTSPSTSLDASQFALLGIENVKDMVKGTEFTIDSKTPEGNTKGKGKIVDIAGDVMTIESDVVVISKTSPEPMNLLTTSKVDFAKNLILRVDGTIKSGIPQQPGIEIQDMKFSMVRL